jgi:hypothetical protein
MTRYLVVKFSSSRRSWCIFWATRKPGHEEELDPLPIDSGYWTKEAAEASMRRRQGNEVVP